ncbi:hypothetical protein IV203_027585 [Nitzschia inconspicua]|uniref:Uncharacterized protein n=1 Tax=Nitzschia inconspicua TaxID=303405 RepID=A0A9K3Q673_9STRA|nr:hypothetical protein IV203_027585 [Nitzschia inconspicua]
MSCSRELLLLVGCKIEECGDDITEKEHLNGTSSLNTMVKVTASLPHRNRSPHRIQVLVQSGHEWRRFNMARDNASSFAESRRPPLNGNSLVEASAAATASLSLIFVSTLQLHHSILNSPIAIQRKMIL